MSIKILLVDDHQILRDGLIALIEREHDMSVVGSADNGRHAISMVAEKSPNVVIMDVAMPGMNGIEATRRIKSCEPGVKVLGLSMYSDSHYVMEMLKAGASGYMVKDCAFTDLAHAVRTVAADHMYLSHSISSVVIRDYLNLASKGVKTVFSVLAPREREVLQLIAEGKSTKDIAALLKVSVKTIETYRKQVMDKLEIYSVAELTKYAIREGLISLDR